MEIWKEKYSSHFLSDPHTADSFSVVCSRVKARASAALCLDKAKECKLGEVVEVLQPAATSSPGSLSADILMSRSRSLGTLTRGMSAHSWCNLVTRPHGHTRENIWSMRKYSKHISTALITTPACLSAHIIQLASIRTGLSFSSISQPRLHQFLNLCGHHQVEVLRIPKHPQLAKFGLFLAKLCHFQKSNVLR